MSSIIQHFHELPQCVQEDQPLKGCPPGNEEFVCEIVGGPGGTLICSCTHILDSASFAEDTRMSMAREIADVVKRHCPSCE
jgi:hypothetical protein